MQEVKDDKNILISLLNAYSVKEIVAIFSEIDEKITQLSDCSSGDFMNFNAHLKHFYKLSAIISENASSIFETISGTDNRNFFNELQNFQDRLKDNVVTFERQINHSIKTLEKILINMNMMFVPLNNFNQNLMTLKFLFTNLKFNISYIDNQTSTYINSQTKHIDELIRNIKSNYPVVNESLHELKEAIKDTLLKLKEIKERNAMNAQMVLDHIKLSISFLVEINNEAALQLPKLKEKTEHLINSIDKIITNIQFQDIIRQKMEHIQDAHKEIIKELDLLDRSAESEGVILTKQAKCFLQIRDIAALQVAQLIFTNKEYQNAIGIITRKFFEIGDDMNTISTMSQEFSGHSYKTEETHFKEVEEKLKNIIRIIEQFAEVNYEYIYEIDSIHIAIEKMSVNFNNIFDLENKLSDLASTTIEITADNNVKANELEVVSKQIRTLFSDAYVITNNLKNLYEQTINLSIGLLSEISHRSAETAPEAIDKNLDELVNNIRLLLTSIMDKNYKIRNLLSENNKLANMISSDIRNSFDEVKYYDFFERVIEDIILKLNSIHIRLQAGKAIDSDFNRIENLRSVEKNYTVESEHIVLDNIVNQRDSYLQATKNAERQEETEGTLELF